MAELAAPDGQVTRLGRYVLHEEIGRGPSFLVHRGATHGALGFVKDVAIKIPHASLAADPVRHEALLGAARRAITLSHASLLQLVDIGQGPLVEGEAAVMFLVTELARGPTLALLMKEAVDRGLRVSLAAILTIGAEVARSLDCAHRRSLERPAAAHGALHAGQVFVTREGQVKVADFCVSAPALFSREDGERSDLAALGSLLSTLCGVAARPPTRDVEDLVDKLSRGELDDAAGVHERLLEIAFQLAPALEERDPGVLVRGVLDGAVAPAPDPPLDLAMAIQPAPSPSPPVARERGAAGGLFRFVGRARELHELGVRIARTLQRGASTLGLHGPAGIGKTRLVKELARRVPGDRVGFVFVECSSSRAPVSLDAIGGLLRGLLGVAPHGQLESDEIVAKLRSMGLDGAEVASLCRALGVPFVVDAASSAIHDGLARLLGVVRMGRPLVVIMDHAHDLDPASFGVLRALVESDAATDLPVLFILVQRSWEADKLALTDVMALGELDDDDVAQLLSNRLGARLLPPELFELVIQRAGGHPAFLEELARELLDAALVRVRAGVAELVSEPPADLLGSLAAIIEARMTRLEPESRRALAMVGLSPAGLSAEELAPLTEGSSELAARALEDLVQAGLARSAAGSRFFVSRVYADAALGLLPPAERSQVHARLGATFAAHARRLGEVAASASEASSTWLIAAEHLRLAGADASAAEALYEAAHSLECMGSFAAASDLFARALFGLVQPELAVRCLEALARLADHAVFTSLDLEEALGQAFLTAADSMTRASRARVCVALANALSRTGQLETAVVLLDQAEMLGDGPLPVILDTRLSLAARACDPLHGERALESFSSGIGRGDQGSLQPWLDAVALAVLMGDSARAMRLLEGAPTADASPGQRAQLLLAQGGLAGLRGDTDAAARSYEQALSLSRAARPSREAAISSLRLAELALTGAASADGRARAFGLLSEGASLAREAGDESLHEVARAAIALVERGPIAREALLKQIDRAVAQGRIHDGLWLALLLHGSEHPPDHEGLTSLAERAERSGFGGIAQRARALLG